MATMATTNTYQVHLYLPEEFRPLLKAEADRENRSVNNLIQVLLREALERRKKDASGA